MKIQTQCPACSTRYAVKNNLLGKKLKCKCGKVFTLTQPVAESAEQLGSVDVPQDFWYKQFDGIEDEVQSPAIATKFEARDDEPKANFEATLSMDPVSGVKIYGVLCALIGILFIGVWLLLGFFVFGVNALSFILLPILVTTGIAVFYPSRALLVNHRLIKINNEGITVQCHNKLPWPCWGRHIPIDAIEYAQIQCRTVTNSPLLGNAEYSHTTYGSKGRTYDHYFVYDLICKLKSNMFETRVASVTDRAVSKSMRLQLKRLLRENESES